MLCLCHPRIVRGLHWFIIGIIVFLSITKKHLAILVLLHWRQWDSKQLVNLLLLIVILFAISSCSFILFDILQAWRLHQLLLYMILCLHPSGHGGEFLFRALIFLCFNRLHVFLDFYEFVRGLVREEAILSRLQIGVKTGILVASITTLV